MKLGMHTVWTCWYKDRGRGFFFFSPTSLTSLPTLGKSTQRAFHSEQCQWRQIPPPPLCNMKPPLFLSLIKNNREHVATRRETLLRNRMFVLSYLQRLAVLFSVTSIYTDRRHMSLNVLKKQIAQTRETPKQASLLGDPHDEQTHVYNNVAMEIWSWSSNVAQACLWGRTSWACSGHNHVHYYHRCTLLLYQNDERVEASKKRTGSFRVISFDKVQSYSFPCVLMRADWRLVLPVQIASPTIDQDYRKRGP